MCLVQVLDMMKAVEVRINVNKGVKSIYQKANLVPQSIKEKIEVELERLVSENIFLPVEYSEWAFLIEPVKKI